ncbi:GNAT family N-acetyltransferase [Methylobacterium sp. WSM2598]|uniref:GNAT family N-acetyltransferase n=1 Tax=Methylobacterium sp. WSM2598 TaxID=398261 RepID=UPI00036EADFA|nr:GNAT family N-acetyltransferase [Methylobacterium sp. WSM2598]
MSRDLEALPVLRTARLRLARLAEADAPALQRLTDDPAITGAIHFLPSPFAIAEARALIAGADGGRDRFLGAWRCADETLVGVLGAHLRGDDRVEIGYWFAPAAQGRGLAREAAAALVAALRQAVPGRLPVAECREDNQRSWRLLHALGFRASGESGSRPGRRLLVWERG